MLLFKQWSSLLSGTIEGIYDLPVPRSSAHASTWKGNQQFLSLSRVLWQTHFRSISNPLHFRSRQLIASISIVRSARRNDSIFVLHFKHSLSKRIAFVEIVSSRQIWYQAELNFALSDVESSNDMLSRFILNLKNSFEHQYPMRSSTKASSDAPVTKTYYNVIVISPVCILWKYQNIFSLNGLVLNCINNKIELYLKWIF